MRCAFAMWVPLGLLTIAWLWALPAAATRRRRPGIRAVSLAQGPGPPGGGIAGAADRPPALDLPAPHKTGHLDDRGLSQWAAFRELVGIRSMRFAMLGLGTQQTLSNGLSFLAGGNSCVAPTISIRRWPACWRGLALGAAVGVVAGGFIADRVFGRGVIDARVWVTGLAAIGAAAVLAPACRHSPAANPWR
ncbi:MAG: hypothetical protein U5K56_20930 [Halioglobus sp.]|nr:hypothetical protein [Halioglobus sp.]